MFPGGKHICHEVGSSSLQCRAVNDCDTQKTSGTIVSKGLWDTLSVDIIGSLSVDCCLEFIIAFVDCFSKYMILAPSRDHTAMTVCNSLLNLVIPYFGVPHHLLSDCGREFTSQIWSELLSILSGIQHLVTSPYHSEVNAINDRNHRTIKNIL